MLKDPAHFTAIPFGLPNLHTPADSSDPWWVLGTLI